ncbi:DUF6599 family protein [Carboxylicivirga sp. N1Y90]|uniref:DUF6599 family protein n=1 Tax=Carboxylicivirga fragile TaxID=3417571 RepID=UPI003D340F18|nr:hypothetical protein [Marinilabiliaceae bacterium N1Y90]
MSKIFLVITFFLLFIEVKGQSDYEVESEQRYDAGALYGYMNGGSELYREYDFISLTVQSIKYDDGELKFEVYEMKDSDMAFGIYSVNTYRCQGNELADLHHVCSNPYQIQVAIGSYYLSLINTTGSAEAQSISNEIVQAFIDNNQPLSNREVPDWYNDLGADDLLLMNGRLGFENRASTCSYFYEMLGVKQCYVAKWKKHKATLLVVKLVDSANVDEKMFLPVEEKYQWLYKQKGDYSFYLQTPLNSFIAKDLLDKF